MRTINSNFNKLKGMETNPQNMCKGFQSSENQTVVHVGGSRQGMHVFLQTSERDNKVYFSK